MRKQTLLSVAISTALSTTNLYAADLPQNHKITDGNAKINTLNKAMTITQESPRVSIEWESFDIGKQNSVEFKQPDSTAIAYNRVMGGNASQIQGKLQANGRVFLANPNGVIITKGAEINVGSLLATTKDLEKISNSNNFNFTPRKNHKTAEGKIINEGKIVANGENAFVVLVGNEVENKGTIDAKYFKQEKKVKERVCNGWSIYDCYEGNPRGFKWIEYESTKTIESPGQVILGAGGEFTLELDTTSISVNVDDNTVNSIVKNSGLIITKDGYIELTAKGKNELINNLVNNDGLLQADNIAMSNSGKITLFSDDIQFGKNSNIQAENLEIKAGKNEINLNAEKGAKLTVKEEIKFAPKGYFDRSVNKVNLSGDLIREDENYYDDGSKKLKTKVNLDLADNLDIGNQKVGENSFISSNLLGSLLGISGEVNLTAHNFDISGDINIDSYKDTDSVLLLNTQLNYTNPSYIRFNKANIDTKNGRLFIATDLMDKNFADKGISDIQIIDSKFNFNNGAIVLGRNGLRRNLEDSRTCINLAYCLEDTQRSPFSVNISNLQLDKVDDFVIVGGFNNVDIDRLTHIGRGNFYIYGGYSYNKEKPSYDYAIFNTKDRALRTERNHTQRRWKFNNNLRQWINNEFLYAFDWWTATNNSYDKIKQEVIKTPKSHLETTINIRNSNIKTHDGFINLMAKNINLTDSQFNVTFDRNMSFESDYDRIHKIGLSADKTILDHTSLNIQGAEKLNVSPSSKMKAATMYVVGDLEGRNKSSINLKSHQGYTLMTDKNATLRGEKSKNDLTITLLNTGPKPSPEIGITGSADNDANAANFALALGDATKTTIENATVIALAPNGAKAYYSHKDMPIVLKNTDFTFYEQPRGTNYGDDELAGEGNIKRLNERQLNTILDKLNGLKPTYLSREQSNLVENNKFGVKSLQSETLEDEKSVVVSICDENNKCEDRIIGNKHTDAKVSVGEIR
ncbi:filamentous hemagglutinin N-terminal domain-containing protein [Glaesserella parasuis]|uniref:two-partner secretion domain-containing protein n=1 Tax=Glaesserella parasuis TaxID=738 RepID=UPI001A95089D|nr:filamentous hemagglutinin N-terminal domain-containing protein [Glaesserella parasuis]MDO9932007.1 filamentous hemagglutinin N-terminal domain-containing protein [Glaesserella parasuis]MDP0021207.1 filamentous hemagglutinin N-terminal domain-containing protein [Glaesserella parasuis]MDP0033965.1 filamentous hemagglutinin N-terminal domain-containing protein [Glaesserella parasuis]QSX10458.1 filamentous hemagglutinin N-terminal domain-containing protein [Glaesserella parasuis]